MKNKKELSIEDREAASKKLEELAKSLADKKRNDRVLPIHLFSCDACKGIDAMQFDDFKKHLADEHNIITEEDLTGTKKMAFHMDMTDSFSSTYNWTLNNGFTFQEYYEGERDKNDIFRVL